jgi:hypothetical protein
LPLNKQLDLKSFFGKHFNVAWQELKTSCVAVLANANGPQALLAQGEWKVTRSGKASKDQITKYNNCINPPIPKGNPPIPKEKGPALCNFFKKNFAEIKRDPDTTLGSEKMASDEAPLETAVLEEEKSGRILSFFYGGKDPNGLSNCLNAGGFEVPELQRCP